MKKQLIFLITISFIAGGIVFYSCKKKSDNSATPTPTSTSPFIQATVNGALYKATNRISVPNDSAFILGTVLQPVDTGNGSYINYTSPFKYGGHTFYGYTLAEFNLVGKQDTLSLGFIVASLQPLTTGTYNLIGINTTPNTWTPFGFASCRTSTDNFIDSIVTGKMNITQLDTTHNVASGTFNFTDYGSTGSSPSTYNITNGQFSNLPIQKF